MEKSDNQHAREVVRRPVFEKLITLARTGTVLARRRVTAILNDRRLVDEAQEFTGKTVVQKLFEEVAPKFLGRNGAPGDPVAWYPVPVS